MSIVEQLQLIAMAHNVKLPALMLMDLINLVYDQRQQAMKTLLERVGVSYEP